MGNSLLTRLGGRHFRKLRPDGTPFAHLPGELSGSRSPRRRQLSTPKTQLPVRVGIFKTVAGAERAVRGLPDAGFAKEQLSVICSEEYKERHFRDLRHPPIPGSNTAAAIATGGVVGAAIGGLALAASAVATGGATLLTVG